MHIECVILSDCTQSTHLRKVATSTDRKTLYATGGSGTSVQMIQALPWWMDIYMMYVYIYICTYIYIYMYRC